MKPNLPLPWQVVGNMIQTDGADLVRVTVARTNEGAFSETPDAEYIIHACNAYPELVAVMKSLLNPKETGDEKLQAVKDGRALLTKLGETP